MSEKFECGISSLANLKYKMFSEFDLQIFFLKKFWNKTKKQAITHTNQKLAQIWIPSNMHLKTINNENKEKC